MSIKPLCLLSSFCLFIVALSSHTVAESLTALTPVTPVTPIGAVAGPNEDGSIPAWKNDWSKYPESYNPKTPYILPNPFSDEKPLYFVSSENIEEHSAHLSEGQIALLKRYPETLKLPVYPSHRVVGFPEKIYTATEKNRQSVKLVNQGAGLEGYKIGVPFAQPTQAEHVLWNHITRYRGENLKRRAASLVVAEDGSFTKVAIDAQVSFAHSLKGVKKDSNILFYLRSRITAPARMAGDVLLVHETFDQLKETRKAWIYSSGQRRVRQIPGFAYDSDVPFSNGFIVSDQVDMYNGAPDRYDWKLLGKREMLIPYHSYDLASRDLGYKDIVLKGHVNPDHLRYEKHRVWVVQGTLKDGARHIYGKRTFYVDEDTWQISVVDYYDERGELWRVGEAYNLYFYHEKIPLYAAESIFDLGSNRFVISGLSNEENKALQFNVRAKVADYTPAALRRSAR